MRALILCLALAAAFPALAQTGGQAPAPSKEALGLGARVARSANPRLERNIQMLVESLAANYRNDATRTGQPVDEKALADAVKGEADAIKPLIWNDMAKVYAQTYTVDELKALNAFYRDNPGAPPEGLPTSLGAKNGDIQDGQRAVVAQLAPRIVQDLFGDYCSRAACSDDTRRSAGLPVRARN